MGGGVLFLEVVVVVLFDGFAPAGRGGEGSGRLEVEEACSWWTWTAPCRREDGWSKGASAVAIFVQRLRFPSRRGGRLSGRLHVVEVLSPLRMVVRRRRRGLGAREHVGGSDRDSFRRLGVLSAYYWVRL